MTGGGGAQVSGFGLVLGGTVLSASTDVEPNRALGEHELLVELVAELERAAFSFLVPNTWVPVYVTCGCGFFLGGLLHCNGDFAHY